MSNHKEKREFFSFFAGDTDFKDNKTINKVANCEQVLRFLTIIAHN
jgi:hypothetical protein